MGTRDTCRLGRHPEELSRLWYSGHVAHLQASGESITRWTSRRTRELPGRLAAHSQAASGEACGALGGFRGGLRRTRRQVSCSEGDSKGGVSKGLSAGFRDTWPSPKGSEGGSGE